MYIKDKKICYNILISRAKDHTKIIYLANFNESALSEDFGLIVYLSNLRRPY